MLFIPSIKSSRGNKDFLPYERVSEKKFDGRILGRLGKNPQVHSLRVRYFEDIPNEELMGKFGQADLVVDNFGVLAYTLNLGLAIEKIATIMKTGADLWLPIHYASVMMPDGTLLSTPEFLAETGLFEAVDFKTGELRNTGKLLRRTNKPVYTLPRDDLRFGL